MGGMEVTADRLLAHESGAWGRHFAAALSESARLSASNEAIVGRVREVEQQLADADQITQQVREENRQSQEAVRSLVEERDALASQCDALGRSVERGEERHREITEKWADALEEKNRLRQMVRDLGGDPDLPAPARTAPDGHAGDCFPASVAGCSPGCPLKDTPGERPIPFEMRTKADETRAAQKRVEIPDDGGRADIDAEGKPTT